MCQAAARPDGREMRRSIKSLIAGCLAGALGLAGCGGTSTPTDDAATDVVQSQEEVAQSEPEPEEPEGPSEADLEAYFEALSSNDPTIIREVLPLTVPGSIAYTYATYYAGLQQSMLEGGYEEELMRTSRIEDGFERCPEEPTEDNPCFHYTNIQHEGDKITDFDLNGESLHDRLTLGDGEAVPLGELAEITQVASYKSVAGYVISILEITATSEGLVTWISYIAPDGEEYGLGAYAGSENIPTESKGTYSVWFEDVEFGGIIKIDGPVGEPVDDVYETVSVEFPTK